MPEGNYRQGTFFRLKWIVINLATLSKALKRPYTVVLVIISLKHYYLEWNLFLKCKQTCACTPNHTFLPEVLVKPTSGSMISPLHVLWRCFSPCLLIGLIIPRQKLTQLKEEKIMIVIIYNLCVCDQLIWCIYNFPDVMPVLPGFSWQTLLQH